MILSEFVLFLRNELCVSQAQLAKCLRLSQATIATWESKNIKLSPKSLKKLIRYCQKNSIEFMVKQ